MTHAELLAPIVRSVRDSTGMSGPQIEDIFADWDLVPVTVDGQHVGTFAVMGTEVHFALVPGWRPRASYRGLVRQVLQPLFEEHGFLTTRVAHERPDQKKFVQRVGFEPTWQSEHGTFFMLTKLPFERKAQ